MSNPTADEVMQLLKANLATLLPNQIVTRDAMDFAQRPDSAMRKGVLTLVSERLAGLKAPRDYTDMAGQQRIWLTWEFKLPEAATGETVERAELACWEQIRAFMKAPGAGLCPLDAITVYFSAQAKPPWGWIAVELEYSELEF